MKSSRENMMNEWAVVLIVAEPGPLRDGLLALLEVIPQVNRVEQVDDILLAVEVVAAQYPAVVVLDADLPEDQVQILLRHVKATSPETRCIVLVDTVQQHQGAITAGANAVLFKGSLAADLVATLGRLLPQSAKPSNGTRQ